MRVNIHRCLGVMEDVDDISGSGVDSTSGSGTSVRQFGVGRVDDENDLSGAEDENPTHAVDAEETLPAEMVIPEHLSQLLANTMEHLTSDDERQKVTALLLAYQDIFAKDDTDIGKTDVITHDVDTGGCKPVCQPLRRQSKEEHEAMVSIVNNLRRCGVIQPSRSQWAANIRMAKKKNGQWRMCIDYRDLNKRTVINDPYPLPRIDALLDTLGRGKVFCALDLISGYHQVPMTRRAQECSAFLTPHMSPSHWEYKYMPFGLTGAPATFQRLVDTMLRGIQYMTVLAYIDDIIVIGQTEAECRENLVEALERIRKAKLKLKPSKCELFKSKITYLGHVISAAGVETDPKKIQVVREWPVPS